MTIGIVNQKGGSGKTHLTVLVTLALAAAGKKVLAVDCDPQGGLSAFLGKVGQTGSPQVVRPGLQHGLSIPANHPGIFEVLTGMCKIEEAVIAGKRDSIGFHFIRARHTLDRIAPGSDLYEIERKFKKAKGFDCIVFDSPPTMQGISKSIAHFCGKIYIPSDISEGSIQPTLYTLDILKEIKRKGQVILIGYKHSEQGEDGFIARLSREFREKLGKAYLGSLPRNISMQKSVSDTAIKWTDKKVFKTLKPVSDLIGI